jgi:hypothetical protein
VLIAGFTETEIQSGLFQVRFKGDEFSSAERTADFAMPASSASSVVPSTCTLATLPRSFGSRNRYEVSVWSKNVTETKYCGVVSSLACIAESRSRR